MRLLLDTQVVLGQLAGSRELPSGARTAIGTAEELYFSAVSFAEVGIKASVGKLEVPRHFHREVLRSGLKVHALDPHHGLAVARLPQHHRDPFDRLLIAQAIAEKLAIVTADGRFADYGVRVVDAS